MSILSKHLHGDMLPRASRGRTETGPWHRAGRAPTGGFARWLRQVLSRRDETPFHGL